MRIKTTVQHLGYRGLARYREATWGTVKISVGGVSAKFMAPDRHISIHEVAETEQQMLSEWCSSANEYTTVWDVGSELGIYSALAGVQGATVQAFEPRGRVAAKTRVNLRTNGVTGDVNEAALGGYEETPSKWLQENCPTAELSTGDAIARENGTPDVVKVDIEGGELEFLKGFFRRFRKQSTNYDTYRNPFI